MIKVGIIGSTGYAGAEIVRILLNHPEAEIVWYGSRSYVDQKFASVFGNFTEIVDAKNFQRTLMLYLQQHLRAIVQQSLMMLCSLIQKLLTFQLILD